jgi:hypothetical protein
MDIGRIGSNGPGFDAKNPGHMLVAVVCVEALAAHIGTCGQARTAAAGSSLPFAPSPIRNEDFE